MKLAPLNEIYENEGNLRFIQGFEEALPEKTLDTLFVFRAIRTALLKSHKYSKNFMFMELKENLVEGDMVEDAAESCVNALGYYYDDFDHISSSEIERIELWFVRLHLEQDIQISHIKIESGP